MMSGPHPHDTQQVEVCLRVSASLLLSLHMSISELNVFLFIGKVALKVKVDEPKAVDVGDMV